MRVSFHFSENGRIAGAKALAKNKTVCALASSNYWSCTENSSNNSWNVNFNNGNANNNNKYNTNVVRAVAALADDEIQSWIDAYDACCKNKRTSTQCSLYRVKHEEDLLLLAVEVKLRVYAQGPSDAFCVKYPKVREIFAAGFRDRVAQHWIVSRLEPLFDDLFIEAGDVSYNCRKGYGTLAAINKQKENIERISENWTREAWVGSGDISAFFMSICTELMSSKLDAFIIERYRGDDIEDLRWLTNVVISHEPQHNCVRKGDTSLWNILPAKKSLFGSEKYRGMPIGNITTQQTANFFMTEFDEWAVKEVSSFDGAYIRFVDDIRVVAQSKEDISAFFRKAKSRLSERLKLTIHPSKRYLQPVRHGDLFVGAVIKPHRTYISNRTRGRMEWVFSKMEDFCEDITRRGLRQSDIAALEHYCSSANSYMGFLIHHNTYAIRTKLFLNLVFFWRYYTVENRFSKVKLKKKIYDKVVFI